LKSRHLSPAIGSDETQEQQYGIPIATQCGWLKTLLALQVVLKEAAQHAAQGR
jgi:hypothetical protein